VAILVRQTHAEVPFEVITDLGCSLRSSGAVGAPAEDLHSVVDVGESRLGGDAFAQRSIAGPSTSTLRPQERQVTW